MNGRIEGGKERKEGKEEERKEKREEEKYYNKGRLRGGKSGILPD